MAQPTNLYDTYDVVGRREDLTDAIYMISPTRTPVLMMAGRAEAKNRYHEWQSDSLAAVDDDNAVIEGDDATTNQVNPTTRVGNHCQISDKVIALSGTVEAEKRAGRKSEWAREMRKKSKELKRDMEAIISRNKASVAGSSVLARRCASIEAFLTTNVSRGGGAGASGGFAGGVVAAAVDGDVRALTETLFKNVLETMWTNGAEAPVILVGPKMKKKISSTFDGAGKVQRRQDAVSKRVTAAVDVYDSDWGQHRIMPSRWNRDRTILYLDPDYIKLAYLRGFRTRPLAVLGDSDRKQMLVEYTLEVNESAHGALADLDVAA